jgi:hydrogenase nickel incorporation protein HypA/HybF
MHEVSLLQDLVELVAAEARKQPFTRVHVIRLKLGILGHAEPDALQFCFDAVTSGTIADGARLEIEMVPALGLCVHCRLTTKLQERFTACPGCGGVPLRIVAGDEMRLAELEVE